MLLMNSMGKYSHANEIPEKKIFVVHITNKKLKKKTENSFTLKASFDF